MSTWSSPATSPPATAATAACVGQLVCPVSRLSALVAELARSVPGRPIDLSLVVDTGLGAVPEGAVDGVLPGQPAHPAHGRDGGAARRRRDVAGPGVGVRAGGRRRGGRAAPPAHRGHRRHHGLAGRGAPGRRARLRAQAALRRPAGVGRARQRARRGVRAGRRRDRARRSRCWGCARSCTRQGRHGILNLLLAVARALAGEDVRDALETPTAPALAAEVPGLSERAVKGVRGLVSRCGVDLDPLPTAAAVGPAACSAEQVRPASTSCARGARAPIGFLGPHATFAEQALLHPARGGRGASWCRARAARRCSPRCGRARSTPGSCRSRTPSRAPCPPCWTAWSTTRRW